MGGGRGLAPAAAGGEGRGPVGAGLGGGTSADEAKEDKAERTRATGCRMMHLLRELWRSHDAVCPIL